MNFGDYYEKVDEFADPGLTMGITAPGDKESALPKTFMGPEHLGTPLNPFQHQLAALNAKLKSGAGKIEFNFPGKGKGTSQSPTPESYGKRERRDIKELIDVTGVKTSVHATFGMTGFSGLGERGFSDYAQEENLKEIKKAIEFSAEATDGGAVVFHTGEYHRGPGQTGHDKDFYQFPDESRFNKDGFVSPEDRSKVHYIVDKRTGMIPQGMTYSETQKFYEPKFRTAKDIGAVGKFDSRVGRELTEFDYVDLDGKYLDPLNKEDMFKRIPEFKEENTEFTAKQYSWKDLIEKTERYNKDHNTNLSPALFKAKEDIINQGLQQRASSIYHGQRYKDYIEAEKKLLESQRAYEELEKNLGKEEVWKIMKEDRRIPVDPNLVRLDNKLPSELIAKELRQIRDTLKHTHESSASADSRAMEAFETAESLETMENLGKERTAAGIARMGMHAWEQTKRWNPKNPVYIAPENLWVGQYGSHPKEIIDLTKKARNEMIERLRARGIDENEAKKLAKNHIKSTVDIGHLNMWKQYYKKEDPDISPQQRDKEFKKWVLKWTDKMIKEDVVGHIHVSDNFGYDDEHLTPGEGNAPIKEFLEEMEKTGYNDIIIEPGSFNPDTILHDSWAYLDSPIYGARSSPGFRSIHGQHFGRQAPPFYIVGGYSPSNEWRSWSEVPLE